MLHLSLTFVTIHPLPPNMQLDQPGLPSTLAAAVPTVRAARHETAASFVAAQILWCLAGRKCRTAHLT